MDDRRRPVRLPLRGRIECPVLILLLMDDRRRRSGVAPIPTGILSPNPSSNG